MSPIGQSKDPFDMMSTLSALPGNRQDYELSAIRIRKLPTNFDQAQLRSMLTFADKLEGTEFVSNPGDQGFKTAIARFYNPSAAQQAQSVLDGKQIDPDRPKLIVETLRLSPGSIGSERRTFDQSTPRAHSGSSSGSTSRYGQFQPMNHIGSPEVNGYRSPPNGDYFPDAPQRLSGRDVIGEDGPDEETSDLLRDPVAYATNGLSRRNTDKPRYNNLSLNTTNHTSPSIAGYTSPPTHGIRSPISSMPGGIPPNSYQVRHPNLPRTNMPPVNPADQNPPCNTLYVGNLPIDTSEDELKAMFSKQRGYKRLCFRTKQNGPMCFVEFEDVSFATKALNDLYGYPLHNSAHRGGIRLSFSKNPLGVRSGQPGGMGGPISPLSPNSHFPAMNGVGMQPFSTASGPPPGIPTPPGLPMSSPGGSNGMSPTSMGFPGPAMSPTSMGYGLGDMNAAMAAHPYSAGGGWQGGYPGGR